MLVNSPNTAEAMPPRRGDRARRRARTTLTGLLALAMLSSTAVVLAPTAAASTASPCKSVGIYGVRGSGETQSQGGGFGDTVLLAVRSLEGGLSAANRNYAELPVNYTAASVDLLNPFKPDFNVRAFLASIEDGKSALLSVIDIRTRKCPKETPVFIGYSQGAMVVRLALQRLQQTGRTSLLARIGGVGLIADPTKQRSEPNLGSAEARSIGIAQQFSDFTAAPVNIPQQVIGRYIHGCNYNDVVCDWTATGLVSGGRMVHSAYKTSLLPAQVGAWMVKPSVARSIAPPTIPTPQPPVNPPPVTPPPAPAPQPGSAQVTLAQGPAAPSGYRYAVTVNGFSPGSAVTVTCFDSVSRNGFYNFNLTTNSSGSASTSAYCYSGDGPDHWVTANGKESNHVTWGGSAPAPPPATTYSETTGGVAHTWTNYTNAGGNQGPSIGANATVQIACKVTGFRVADGDTWWYRIASSPWNGAYYVSADAFFNNGRTSGSLAGTPFVDPAVPNC